MCNGVFTSRRASSYDQTLCPIDFDISKLNEDSVQPVLIIQNLKKKLIKQSFWSCKLVRWFVNAQFSNWSEDRFRGKSRDTFIYLTNWIKVFMVCKVYLSKENTATTEPISRYGCVNKPIGFEPRQSESVLLWDQDVKLIILSWGVPTWFYGRLSPGDRWLCFYGRLTTSFCELHHF